MITAVAHSVDPPVDLGSRAQAAIAYSAASEAYLAHRYDEAGALYVRAYKLIPSASALVQAARSFWYSGDRLMASRLAVQAVLKHSYKEIGIVEGDGVVCMPTAEANELRDLSKKITSTVNKLSKPRELPINPF
jgi:hypothetical protein